MNQQFLVLNPQIAVLHLDGEILAGHISGAQLIKFQPIDLVLLAQFAAGANVMDVVRNLQQGPERQLLAADPVPQGLVNRIQALYQSQVLKASSTGVKQSPRIHQTVQRLEDCAGTHQLSPDARLRIPANVALRPDGTVMRVWSSSSRATLCPDLRLQLLLFAFSKEREVSEVIAEKGYLATAEECGRGIQWLFDQGLLYSTRDRLQGLLSPASKNMPSPSGYALTGKGPRWQNMEPDGRIPVYFTPHMENHYPLAIIPSANG